MYIYKKPAYPKPWPWYPEVWPCTLYTPLENITRVESKWAPVKPITEELEKLYRDGPAPASRHIGPTLYDIEQSAIWGR